MLTGYIGFEGGNGMGRKHLNFRSMFSKHAVWFSVVLQKLILNGKKKKAIKKVGTHQSDHELLQNSCGSYRRASKLLKYQSYTVINISVVFTRYRS